jgi:Zn-finger nucleic acid-binding protein
MNCPIDGAVLKPAKRHKIEVDECPTCKGTWLSAPELDRLEDIKFDLDHLKGSILTASVETTLPCPVCRIHLHEFKYRYHQLRLDLCPDQHGFWLDFSEDKRVLEIMDQRKRDALRKVQAENEWANIVRHFHFFMFSKNPGSLFDDQPEKQKFVRPPKETRPPAIPLNPQKLPSTCPKCGGPINSMTVIVDKSRQYTCGYCHTFIRPI